MRVEEMAFTRPRVEEVEYQAIRNHRLFSTKGSRQLFLVDLGPWMIQAFKTRRGAFFVLWWRQDGYCKGSDGGRWKFASLEEKSREEILRLVQDQRIEITNPLKRDLGL